MSSPPVEREYTPPSNSAVQEVPAVGGARPSRMSPPNHIFIGKKPLMVYAMSAMIQLTQSDEIVLKARGMVICRAVDVAEVVSKKLGGGAYEVKNVKIDSEVLGEGDLARNVSTIEIVVGRK